MNWAQTSARVIDALHQPHFPATLIEAIRSVVPFEHTVTFAYCGNRRPIALHSEFPVWKHKVMVEDYQEGPYLLDPFYLQSSRPGDPRLVRLRDMAPDRFYQESISVTTMSKRNWPKKSGSCSMLNQISAL